MKVNRKHLFCTGRHVASVIFCVALVLTASVPLLAQAESKGVSATNTSETTQEIGEPINASTGEYYFYKNLLNLGGAFPIDFSFFYGSQLDSKRLPDGLPTRFAGNHRGSIIRIDAIDPAELSVDTGFGTEIGFFETCSGWDLFNLERTRYVLNETIGYYYLQDPVNELVYTYKKKTVPLEYRTRERLSVSSAGVEGNSWSVEPDISADGRYVVFISYASNLVENDTTTTMDVFVRDRLNNNTICVSVAPDGATVGDANSWDAVISDNGRYVAFHSDATNLVTPDTTRRRHIYVRDLETGQTTLVSVNSSGEQANAYSYTPSISADGRYVAFSSTATNLIAIDTNGQKDVFVHDRDTGKTTLVSVKSDGTQGDAGSFAGTISPDGSKVAFTSAATNLVDNDTNGKRDVFVHTIATEETIRASVSSGGIQSDDSTNSGGKRTPLSTDGRYVAYTSSATNLVADDTNGVDDIFVRDLQAGETTRVSVNSAGAQGTDDSITPDISGDGNIVVFRSRSIFSTGDTNNILDIYVKNRKTGEVWLASLRKDGTQANNDSHRPSITTDGTRVTFESASTNLVDDDTNGDSDIFVAKVYSGDTAFLAKVEDRNGNSLTYETTSDANLELRGPDRIYDGLGRELKLTYGVVGAADTNPYLTTMEDQTGRAYTFAYEEDPTDNAGKVTLRTITDPLGNVTTYQYAGDNIIAKVKKPMENTPYEQTYEIIPIGGIVKTQTDAYGNTTTITKDKYIPYTEEESQFTITYPDASTRTFVHNHKARVIKSIQDPTGKISSFSSDAQRDQLNGVTDRLGDTTSFTYHSETGKPASITNAKADTLSNTYTAQGQTFTNPDNAETVDFTFYNLTRTDYPGETNQQFTYDASGNVLTRVDRAGKTWTYTYNSRGQVLTAANPTGGVTTYTYNADATLASSTDSGIGPTTYGYDGYKRLNRITRPDTAFVQTAYNLNDRVTSITDENNHTYTYTYDANGNMTGVTDPASNNRQYGHDLMDRVNQVTDRLGKVSTSAYDSMGRIASVTDPNTIETSFGYNSRGWWTGTTIGGRTWQTGYDDERVVSSRTTPLGYSTAFQTDRLGHTTGITDPLSRTATFTRDPMGRVTVVTDPLSRTTNYSYDARGLVSGVTLPVAGAASYTRNDLGRLTQITDLNGSNWTFDYSNMGRLQSTTDPLGNGWQHTYDTRGRLDRTTYPDTQTMTRTYDNAGNITQSLYSGGLDLQYTYDGLDRLLTANGVAFTRDAEGRVTATDNPGTIFGATYDDGGRLATATYNNGAFTVTYTYESSTGLLSQVTDSLTNTKIDFSYDNDGRRTGITRSNGVNAAFTYDNAARLTRTQEGGIIDILYTLDAAGQITRADMTVPLDPASLLASETNSFTYDAASQVSSAGYTYDSRGRQTAAPGHTYTWDNASRLTGIDGVTLAYNGLSDLTARTQGAAAIHYYYNYAIGLKPIAAEKDEGTGQFLRYYVWTPGGGLLYMIDSANGNKVYFYHFNHTGSTLALTDSTGAVTDSYAYTPYGKLLQHNGSSEQPFTFVGQWGVRQEGTGGGYQMRARYYDAQTGCFLSRDSVWPALSNPQSLNPYQYASANPLTYIDPRGEVPKRVAASAFDLLIVTAFEVQSGARLWAEHRGEDLTSAEDLVKEAQARVKEAQGDGKYLKAAEEDLKAAKERYKSAIERYKSAIEGYKSAREIMEKVMRQFPIPPETEDPWWYGGQSVFFGGFFNDDVYEVLSTVEEIREMGRQIDARREFLLPW